jgi:hypothetical protein
LDASVTSAISRQGATRELQEGDRGDARGLGGYSTGSRQILGTNLALSRPTSKGAPDVFDERLEVVRVYAIPLHQRMDDRIGKDVMQAGLAMQPVHRLSLPPSSAAQLFEDYAFTAR